MSKELAAVAELLPQKSYFSPNSQEENVLSFTSYELSKYQSKMKNGKANGVDGIKSNAVKLVTKNHEAWIKDVLDGLFKIHGRSLRLYSSLKVEEDQKN